MNGFRTIVSDISRINPTSLEPPDILHASPSCKNASRAKNKAQETLEDVAAGEATARFIDTLRPRFFTLENVWAYRQFQAFEKIWRTLERTGYTVRYDHVCMADWGVPQTRRRLILRAVRGGPAPHLPRPEPWRGWYAAIQDLLPALPEAPFARWQLKRLGGDGAWRQAKAFLVSNAKNEYGDGVRDADEPAYTVTCSSGGRVRARLADGRVVKLTPRALARLQSFPDGYRLPENKRLACAIIGNAVPPLMYSKLIAGMIYSGDTDE